MVREFGSCGSGFIHISNYSIISKICEYLNCSVNDRPGNSQSRSLASKSGRPKNLRIRLRIRNILAGRKLTIVRVQKIQGFLMS